MTQSVEHPASLPRLDRKSLGKPRVVDRCILLQLALEDGLEPGVAVDELAGRLRRVLNEELQSVQAALGRLEEGVGQVARQQESTIGGLSAVELARARMRERRAR